MVDKPRLVHLTSDEYALLNAVVVNSNIHDGPVYTHQIFNALHRPPKTYGALEDRLFALRDRGLIYVQQEGFVPTLIGHHTWYWWDVCYHGLTRTAFKAMGWTVEKGVQRGALIKPDAEEFEASFEMVDDETAAAWLSENEQ